MAHCTIARHAGGAVGLLQIAARRQRAAAVEDPDVVQAEETPRRTHCCHPNPCD